MASCSRHHVAHARTLLALLAILWLPPPARAGLGSQPAWAVEGDRWYADYGISVATAGDVNADGFSDVIVGARFASNGQLAEGLAFLYMGSASGLFATHEWMAESDQDSANFAYSVAPAGDVNGDGFDDVLIGAYGYDGGELNEGRAYLYLGSASGLGPSATPDWSFESDRAGAWLGVSVASAGDVNGDGYTDVLVGAAAYSNDETAEGRSYLFHGSAEGLLTTPSWVVESNQPYAYFGSSVASAGDVNGDGYGDVIIGSVLYDNEDINEGRAFVYLGNPFGLSVDPIWTAESDQAESGYGWSVATAGDVNGDGYADVIVGARQFDIAFPNQGRAFVYLGSPAGPGATASWTGNINRGGAEFGYPVGTAGDVNGDGFADVIVGAWLDDQGQFDEGSAFVYLGSPGGLSPTPVWNADGEYQQGEYGVSAATAGDVNGDGFSDVVIGSPGYDNVEVNEGRAELYHGGAAGLAAAASWTSGGPLPAAHWGQAVAMAGDVNGDGYTDLVAGAPEFAGGETGEGRAELTLGSEIGPSQSPAWTAEGQQAGAAFGAAVASAGDVNGDGYTDVIVGAPGYDGGETDEGQALLFYGGEAGLEATPAWTAAGNQAASGFGSAVAGAGDVNGDGFADVIVGADRYDDGEVDEGRASVYLGSLGGLSPVAAWQATSDEAGASFGFAVAGAGDVNGDGFGDVLVGAENAQGKGRAFAFLGSPLGLSDEPDWMVTGDQPGARLGHAVATAGDVNDDGFADALVGADGYDSGAPEAGRAYLYLGGSPGLATVPAWIETGDQPNAHLGAAVAPAGDVNGDGYAEIAIGIPYHAFHPTGGEVLVHYVSPPGPALPAWTVTSSQGGAVLGQALEGAGDVNGDGFSDLVVGAPRHDQPGSDAGRVFVFEGNEGRGLSRIPHMARDDGTAPIDLLGRSDSPSSLRLRAKGRTPAGRGKVSMQWEVKLAGMPFDGSGLVTGGLFDTGAPTSTGSAVPIDERVTTLNEDTLYRWRLRFLRDSPFFPRSPWFSHPGNTVSEPDVRTARVVSVVEPAPLAPAAYALEPGLPNPFHASTELRFSLVRGGPVKLEIVDVMGRRVALLVEGRFDPGRYATRWDGTHESGKPLPAGIYFARLSHPLGVHVQRLVRLP
jgi:hypothetical protein